MRSILPRKWIKTNTRLSRLADQRRVTACVRLSAVTLSDAAREGTRVETMKLPAGQNLYWPSNATSQHAIELLDIARQKRLKSLKISWARQDSNLHQAVMSRRL